MRDQWRAAFEDAAMDPRGWGAALERLAEATGSMRAQLVGFGGTRALPFNWITNISDHELRLFAAFDGHAPNVNFRVAADRAVKREIVFEPDYDLVAPQLTDATYVDFCEQVQMPFGCQTMLIAGEAGAVGLALLRSRSDGRTDEAIRDSFREAAGVARFAVRMQVALEQQGSLMTAGALEAMSAACLLFDRTGTVCAMTPAAEARLAELDRLRISQRRLVADDAGLAGQIDGAFAALADRDGARHVRLSLRGAAADRPALRLDLFRIGRRDWSFGFEPCFLGVLDAGMAPGLDHAKLALAYGLTAAESAIAMLVADGRSRQEIARRRDVTVETLRGQLKTLYGKTGCRREAELVALLGQLRG